MASLEKSIRDRAAKGQMGLPLSVGSPDMPISPAFEGVLTSDPAAAYYQEQILNEIKILNQRLGLSLGVTTPSGATTGGAMPIETISQPVGRTPSPASEGIVTRTGTMDQDRAPAPAQSPFDDYGRMATYFGTRQTGGFSLANLRQDVGTMMQERLANRTWGPQIVQDPSGKWHDPSTGRFISEEDPAVQSFLKRETVMMAGRGFAQSLAEGRSLGEAGVGALRTAPGGMAALRMAGPVVAGLHVADMAADWGQRQRAENAQWQRMMGGTNFEGFGERIRQNMFGLSQMGFMDPAEAERLYAGVAATGMRGTDRARAQTFALQNYGQFGMTIDQSMEIINTAARTGQESLMGLSTALERVTETAREAGVNTEIARESFVKTWTSVSETIGGTESAAIAAGLAGAGAGLGREYQGVSFGVEMQQISRVAAARGMTRNQLLAAVQEPGGEQMLLQGITAGLQQQAVRGIRPEGGAALAPFQQTVAQGGELTQEQRDQLGQVMRLYGPDVASMMMQLQGWGIEGVTEATAPLIWGEIALGTYNPARAGEEAEAESGTRTIDTGVALGEVSTSTRFSGIMSEEYQALQQKVMKSGQGQGMFNFTDDATRQYFLEDVLRTGRAGGISERLATNATERAGITQVEIIDPQTGQPRTVSLKEAMKSYRDQLDAGTARVIGEGGDMGTIAEVLKTSGDPSLAGAAARGPEGGGAAGSVLFDATPFLKQLIQPTAVQGKVYADPASGWEMRPSNILPSDRATGEGG